jgi:hypothetical protein
MVIRWSRSGLDDKSVRAAHMLFDPDACLAILERADQSLTRRDAKDLANLDGELAAGAAAENPQILHE